MSIDDQPDARESLQLLLEHEGAAVLPFATGRQALAWLDRQPTAMWPQALLCDIAIGDEDGHDVMRSIRRLEARRAVPAGHRMPAIALTGRARSDDRLRALQAGFQAHLAKPVAPHELIQTLSTLAGHRRDGGPVGTALAQAAQP